MENCNLCKRTLGFHEGIKGINYEKTKLMFVANKPDERILELVLPIFDSYDIALSNTKTGKNMKSLLDYCNLCWDDIFWTNLFKCVLEKNKIPSKAEYKNCLENHLNIQIESLKPNLIVALGAQVYKALFPELAKRFKHEEMIGRTYFYKNVETLIYSHPQKIKPPYCNKKKQRELFRLMKNEIKKSLA